MKFALALLIVFALGLWLGADRATSEVINEVDSWHTARLFEDGSWRVEYKDGRSNTGCLTTGLCQD